MFLFSAGDTEKYWNLRLIDDDVFENKETFTLELHDPVMAVIEEPRRARVTIVDDEDGKIVTCNLLSKPLTLLLFDATRVHLPIHGAPNSRGRCASPEERLIALAQLQLCKGMALPFLQQLLQTPWGVRAKLPYSSD